MSYGLRHAILKSLASITGITALLACLSWLILQLLTPQIFQLELNTFREQCSVSKTQTVTVTGIVDDEPLRVNIASPAGVRTVSTYGDTPIEGEMLCRGYKYAGTTAYMFCADFGVEDLDTKDTKFLAEFAHEMGVLDDSVFSLYKQVEDNQFQYLRNLAIAALMTTVILIIVNKLTDKLSADAHTPKTVRKPAKNRSGSQPKKPKKAKQVDRKPKKPKRTGTALEVAEVAGVAGAETDTDSAEAGYFDPETDLGTMDSGYFDLETGLGTTDEPEDQAHTVAWAIQTIYSPLEESNNFDANNSSPVEDDEDNIDLGF